MAQRQGWFACCGLRGFEDGLQFTVELGFQALALGFFGLGKLFPQLPLLSLSCSGNFYLQPLLVFSGGGVRMRIRTR